jgi:putative phosphoribosyl transferase
MPFKNRCEAGRRLAVALAGYKEQEPTILALPRGGVAVAAEVAAALKAPLDLILVRKVGVPFQPELAMGAVVDGVGSIMVRNEDVIEHVSIDEAAFKSACDAEFAEIERQSRTRGDRRPHGDCDPTTLVVASANQGRRRIIGQAASLKHFTGYYNLQKGKQAYRTRGA